MVRNSIKALPSAEETEAAEKVQKDLADRIEAGKKAKKQLEDDILSLKNRIKALPTAEEIEAAEKAKEDLDAEIEAGEESKKKLKDDIAALAEKAAEAPRAMEMLIKFEDFVQLHPEVNEYFLEAVKNSDITVEQLIEEMSHEHSPEDWKWKEGYGVANNEAWDYMELLVPFIKGENNEQSIQALHTALNARFNGNMRYKFEKLTGTSVSDLYRNRGMEL